MGKQLHRARQQRHLDGDAARIDRVASAGERDGGVSPATTMGGASRGADVVPACCATRRARPARLHPARRPARLPDRDEVRQHAHRRPASRCTARPRRSRSSGKNYPAGSFVVKTAQAFRPHVLDMFEPQDHPDDFAYPGGPPTPPYDSAGWTLAFQMGVEFDRVLDGFDGPFERLTTFIEPTATVAPLGQPGRVSAVGHRERRVAPSTACSRRARRVVALRRGSPAGAGTWFVEGAGGRAPSLEKARRGARRHRHAGARRKPAGESVPVGRRASAWGRVRRLDPVRLDPLAARAVRVPVRGRVPADARRRRPRARATTSDCRRRCDPGARAPRRRQLASIRRRCRRSTARTIGRVTADAHGAAAEGVRRRRRHDRGDRPVDGAGRAPAACRSRARWSTRTATAIGR